MNSFVHFLRRFGIVVTVLGAVVLGVVGDVLDGRCEILRRG
jgi:hypothetical protein